MTVFFIKLCSSNCLLFWIRCESFDSGSISTFALINKILLFQVDLVKLLRNISPSLQSITNFTFISFDIVRINLLLLSTKLTFHTFLSILKISLSSTFCVSNLSVNLVIPLLTEVFQTLISFIKRLSNQFILRFDIIFHVSNLKLLVELLDFKLRLQLRSYSAFFIFITFLKDRQ